MASDHCPLLIKPHPTSTHSRIQPPFRFQAMWMNHDNYAHFVSESWNGLSGDFLSKTKSLSNALSLWNKDVFGNIFNQKRRLLSRITGIQKALCKNDSPFLRNLEVELIQEYERIRDKETIFWKQKSREKWIKEGDKNTKFFHITTLVRRRRNKVTGLFAENGILCEDPEQMKNIAVTFFTRLFSVDDWQDLSFQIPNLFPPIEIGDLQSLGRIIMPNEVKYAMFSIGGLKAPGIDGFPASFYQKHWNLVATDVTNLVMDAFQNGKIPDGLNHTLITLVPKVNSPQHMHLFRPISLCTTIYKVISKIIVSRLRPILGMLISPNQVSYVPGRHISDNIMIAQEVFHKYRNTRGKKGYLAWKIDLSKAYDKLHWSFIEQVLIECHLPDNLAKLIMSCVTTTSFQISLNGDLSETFNATRGIRQGDPLSPYLFVLCMERLSHLIYTAVDVGRWKPVKASQSGPAISHLFFADDLILFAEANKSQARTLKKCMNKFCSLSGQSVNFEKSLVYCSPNTSRRLARKIGRICGSPLTNDLGKYLGMPMIHSRVTKSTYADLVDKVSNRLASWKCRHLSMAGRLTLIQAVTSSVPVYAMQTTKLPSQICENIDKLNRNFLWGDSPGKKKIHLISWDSVCRPKCKGGLGIKKTIDMNKAMLAKASWRIVQGDKGLWASIYQKKYLQNGALTEANYSKPPNCSSTWTGVSHGASLLRKGLTWRIGDGSSAKFWIDDWTGHGTLDQQATNSRFVNNFALVNDFWGCSGWNTNRLLSCLPEHVVNDIVTIPISFSNSAPDRLIWKHNPNGNFSVSSAYDCATSSHSSPDCFWKKVWNYNIPPKLKTFAWILAQGRLLTNTQRCRRKLTNDPSCHFCPGVPETMLHLLRDCPKAKPVWASCGIPVNIKGTFCLDWNGWIHANLLQSSCFWNSINWHHVFIFVCWYLWKWRNKRIFLANFQSPFKPGDIISQAIFEWHRLSKSPAHENNSHSILLSWKKPALGHFKLNIDGTRSNAGLIGAGGIIRNSDGVWVKGFMHNIGSGDTLAAEAWGLFTGLKLAHDLHIKQLEVESDSTLVINLIMQNTHEMHPLGTLIHNCKVLMQQFDYCTINHTYRETNLVADLLAKDSISNSKGIHLLTSPPRHIVMAMLDDFAGTVISRVINSSSVS